MTALRTLLDAEQFQAGLFAGVLALGAVMALGNRRGRTPPGLVGAAFAIAGTAALTSTARFPDGSEIPGRLFAGVAIAFVLAEAAGRIRSHPAFVAVAALPGAVVTAGALEEDIPRWTVAVVVGFGSLGAAAIADFDGAHRSRGLGPVMLTVTVVGVYLTVPETEFARTLLGVALPLAFLGRPRTFASIGTGGAAASACLLAYVLGQEGWYRPGAVVGGCAAIGVFALEPLGRRIAPPAPAAPGARGRRRRRSETAWAVAVHVLVAHFALAIIASRWVGFAREASAAGVRLLVVLPLGVALAFGLPPMVDERAPPARRSRRGGRAHRSSAGRRNERRRSSRGADSSSERRRTRNRRSGRDEHRRSDGRGRRRRH